ncbi:MAG: hypothetical protein DI628_08370 [Blastochloris viridis]|uniref:Uncharacterized protein n=1 Tax=Blastochloris viridis TaxID=1079 RepID=A0A6N4RCB7_BLAVI|nr:MAG: hypothetical protein DI628_08370 [Blastochloris viridis]
MEAELNDYWQLAFDHNELAALNAIRRFRKRAEHAPFIREAFQYFYSAERLLHDAAHGYPPEHLARDLLRYYH